MYITREISFIVMAALCVGSSLRASTLKVYNTGSSDIDVQMKWSLKGDFVNFSTVPPGQATSCTVPPGAYWLRAKVGGAKEYSASLAFLPTGDLTYNYYVNKNGDLLSGVECLCTIGPEKELSFTTMAAQCTECTAACTAVTDTILTAVTLPLGLGSTGSIRFALAPMIRKVGFKVALTRYFTHNTIKFGSKLAAYLTVGIIVKAGALPTAVLLAVGYGILGVFIEGECIAKK